MWVYIQTESELWTVGFYAPDGSWHGESDHSHREDAAARIHYLNGGEKEQLLLSFDSRINALEHAHEYYMPESKLDPASQDIIEKTDSLLELRKPDPELGW